MPRGLNATQIKKVIDFVKEKPMNFGEFINLGIPRKSLDRILSDYLEYWGLVRKDENNCWRWFEHYRIFSNRDEYLIALEHSKKLIPELRNSMFVEFDVKKGFGERKERRKCIEDHLRTGYSDLYDNYIKFRKIQYDIEDCKSDDFKISKFMNSLEVNDMLFFNQKLKENKSDNKFHFSKESKEGKLLLELIKIVPEKRLIEWFKLTNKMDELYSKVVGEIHLIMRKIEHGEPIKGICQLCPKVKIKNT